jgi:hypothetical protein
MEYHGLREDPVVKALRMTELTILFRGTIFVVSLLLLACAPSGRSQTAQLSGAVKDSTQAAIPNATITATDDETAIKKATSSNFQGYYNFAFMRPGTYVIKAEAPGFRTITRLGVNLEVGQEGRLDFVLEPATLRQTITVKDSAPSVRSDSTGVSTAIDRQFVDKLSLNGRTFQPLIALVPGIVMTDGDGQFSTNGQRDNANYFTIDGVSANIGISQFRNLGQTAGGSVPGFNVLGGTNNLVSVDAMQEFAVHTSTYSAEFGRTPGGQVQVLTRSGTNRFHGTLFDYFRNDALDANDWFANLEGFQKPPLRHNNFGGVLGGPILKNGTFFFLSYEGLRLRLPQFSHVNVPSRAARAAAPPAIQQLLDAFSLPNGPEDPVTMLGQFSATYSIPASEDATSIRLDHVVKGRLSLFGRYSYASSENDPRVENLTHVIFNNVNTNSFTAGGTLALSSTTNNEFRVNYSTYRSRHLNAADNFRGAIPPSNSLLFPAPFASPRSSRFIFSVDTGLRFVVGRSSDHLQRQLNLVDNVSILKRSHALKFGADFRYLSPIFGPQDYGLQIRFRTVNEAVNGSTPLVSIFTFDPLVLAFSNLSAYAQDSWKLSPSLTIHLGLRWEWNPPPHGKNGQQLYTLSGFDDPSALRLAPGGTLLYQTTYGNFAPRTGLAYQMSGRPGRETVLRGGFGIFYDLGQGVIGQATTSFPHFRSKSASGQPFPLTPTVAAPPLLPSLDPPYSAQSFLAFAPQHVLPRTYQWNIGLEQSLGVTRSISVFYVGAAGRELLRRVAMTGPSPNFINGSSIDLTTNSATSDYNAFQLQFRQRLSRSLQTLVGYTWSHSIDIASTDVDFQLPADKADPQRDRGPSDFDARHALQAAFTYEIPSPHVGRVATVILRDWSLDGILLARTATPVNVTITRPLGLDLVSVRPDSVIGEALYIQDPAVAGGRRINPAAFTVPIEARQGFLGRNALRGFAFTQLDFGVSRKCNLTERVSILGKAEFFNVFNHANFANPDGFLGNYSHSLVLNSFFGVSTAMSASAPINGVTNGLTSLYRMGGPRSIQLLVKLAF